MTTQVPMISTDYITLDEIRQRAHLIWEQGGRPVGLADEHWHTAERQLQAEREERCPPQAAPCPPELH